jgi:hypothetical protein
MDLNQAAYLYLSQFQGFNLGTGVPSPEMSAQTMQALVVLAAQSDMPADGRFHHLEQVVGQVAEVAPQSAVLFNQLIVDNPRQRGFAKALEIALAVMSARSPETWQHILHHTALTMIYYERQTDLAGSSNPVNPQELLTLFVGAMGHDIGKIGIDPTLLHKSTRIDPQRFAIALENYRRLVPNYPEKLHDIKFLEEPNLGRLIFAKPGGSMTSPVPGGLIEDLGKGLRRSEEYWVQDDERQRHNAIWQRINAYAQSYIVPRQEDGWLNTAEQQALTMAQRGTVTPEEMRVIESHDVLSEAFFALAPVPPALSGVQEIVSMARFRQGRATQRGDCLLADIIHTTDVFEALTADRSYRKPYTVEEALKVMDGMAKDGKLNDGIIASLKNNGTIEAYAQAAGIQHRPDRHC